MALSDAQEIALFEVLEVPYSTTAMIPQDEMGLTALEYSTNNASQQAKSLITNHVSGLSSGKETLLIASLDRWIALGTNTTVLDGGAGGLSGVTADPDAERNLIRQKVRTLVPFWRAHERIEIASKRRSSIGLIR